MIIQIISIDNGVGLTRDAKIISDILKADGHEVKFSDMNNHREPAKRYDLNIFIEVLSMQYITTSSMNVLIPNPEWFLPSWMGALKHINYFFCKTHDAEKIFSRHGQTVYTGFTSEDRYDESVKKEKTYVHLPGKSYAKGTKEVIDAFSRNGMPKLKIYSQQQWKSSSSNIDIEITKCADDYYKKIQNQNLIHLCPSSCEGFGHYINEARSAGNVIITTGAPPMNELVHESFGFGCNYQAFKRNNMTNEYHVSVDSMVEIVKTIEACPPKWLLEFGKRARQQFLKDDYEFRERFMGAVSAIEDEIRSKSRKVLR